MDLELQWLGRIHSRTSASSSMTQFHPHVHTDPLSYTLGWCNVIWLYRSFSPVSNDAKTVFQMSYLRCTQTHQIFRLLPDPFIKNAVFLKNTVVFFKIQS